MFCWETLGPGIYVNAKLTHTTHPNTAADQVQSHMVLPASPQKLPRNSSKDVIMSWRRRPGLPIPQIHVQSNRWGPHFATHRTQKDLLPEATGQPQRSCVRASTGSGEFGRHVRQCPFGKDFLLGSHLGNIPELLSRAYIEDPHHNEWRWAASLDLPARRQANSF